VALDAGNFDTTVAEGVSLVEFFHPSCSHCRAMEPVVEQLATDFEERAVVGKVDVTTEGVLTRTWGVRGYPTFLVLKDGQEHDRWLGETSYARLAGMIRAALDSS
jgi:thioredoxin 1